MQNYIFIYLGVILLVFQCYLTSPLPDSDDTPSAEDKKLNEHNKLYKEMLKKFTDFTIEISEDFLEFTTKITEEIKQNNELPDVEHPNRRQLEFTKALEHIKSSESDHTLLNMYKLTEDILEATKTLDDPKFLTEETKKLIEKYKVREFMNKIRERYMKFYESLSEAVDVYADELSETQKHEQQKLLDWNKDLSETKDFQSKTDKFSDFFDFFKPCCEGL
uniref:Uncharacterized protein n=1 Tax=Glossina palpalis gambiensis TaxID=67801 RepID=A0A1B0AQH9_9MUSC